MQHEYAVLGAGRQGVAIAYDLAKNCAARRVTLADAVQKTATDAVRRLGARLPDTDCEFSDAACDVTNPAEVRKVLAGVDVAVSAVPYRFNADLTEQAIQAGVSLCDLGGNTEIVRAQLARHDEARSAGVSIVPDCGLAPGLGNILAAHGVASLDEPQDVHVRCGGLPQERVGPLGYKLVFNFQGLINEYSGFGEYLRDGEPRRIPALTEIEEIEFPAPIGRCEAAVTSGGTSTCPETFAGKLRNYDYKTVRYPGHFAIVRAMFELGCFEDSVETTDGGRVRPREVMRELFESQLHYPEVRDQVVLRVTVRGRHEGRSTTLVYDVFERHDEETGFTAMERATSFPTSLVAHCQARKLVETGAQPPERALPLQQYFSELPQHGIDVRVNRVAG